MRKYLIKTVLCALSLLLFVSCIGAWVKQVNFGFPETITFTKEGGERVYNGNDSFSSIRVYNPEPTDNDNDFSYGYCEETGEPIFNKHTWIKEVNISEGIERIEDGYFEKFKT